MLVLPQHFTTPSPNYSSRGGVKTRLIVWHDCEGNESGSIAWFAMQRSKVSAHLVVSSDGSRAVQMVSWFNKAWAVCNANPFSESYEGAGFSKLGLSAPEWQAIINITAFRCRVLGIPPVYLTSGDCWTKAGVTQHKELGLGGGGHTDVTSDPALIAELQGRLQAAYNEPMPASWGDVSIPAYPPLMPPEFTPHKAVPAAGGGFVAGDTRHDFAVGSIEWVQMELNALHIPVVPLVVDGIDGLATQRAISTFQQRNRLYIDGIPGPQTCAAITAAVGKAKAGG